MKNKIIFAASLLLSTYANSQVYVDANAVWAIPMAGQVGLDVGANVGALSLEVNSLFIGELRTGASVGLQMGERGTENLAMRIFAGIMYGKYNVAEKDDEYLPKHQWKSFAGLKLQQGSVVYGTSIIMSKQPEIQVFIGFQIVEIIKWIKKS